MGGQNWQYAHLMWKKKLTYSDIIKIVPFLLGNGLDPALMKQWFALRAMVDHKDSHTVDHLATRFAAGSKNNYYWDMCNNCWCTFDGVKK